MKTKTNTFRQLGNRHLITSRLLLLGLLFLLVSFRSFAQITVKNGVTLSVKEDVFIHEEKNEEVKVHVSKGTLVHNFPQIHSENKENLKKKNTERFRREKVVNKPKQIAKVKTSKTKANLHITQIKQRDNPYSFTSSFQTKSCVTHTFYKYKSSPVVQDNLIFFLANNLVFKLRNTKEIHFTHGIPAEIHSIRSPPEIQ